MVCEGLGEYSINYTYLYFRPVNRPQNHHNPMYKQVLFITRAIFMPVLFCLMFLQTAFAQASGPSDSLKNILIAKEAEMFRVVLNGDKPAAEKMFATDYMTINADGTMQDKTETMKLFGKFKGATTALSDKRIRTYGNLSIITGGAKFYIKSILVAQIFYTETWIFRNGQWDFIGWQGTMTGLPSWYPLIITVIVLVLLYFLARFITRRMRKRPVMV